MHFIDEAGIDDRGQDCGTIPGQYGGGYRLLSCMIAQHQLRA